MILAKEGVRGCQRRDTDEEVGTEAVDPPTE
jgi:hypothetical protein